MPAALAYVGRPVHPLHAILLAFPIALFTTGLAADLAYLSTAEMQWSNFASWAIVGALVFGGVVLLWGLIEALRLSRSIPPVQRFAYPGLLAIMWLLGLINAFQHSRDAWSSVGWFGLTLSILCVACALVAGWIRYAPRSVGALAR